MIAKIVMVCFIWLIISPVHMDWYRLCVSEAQLTLFFNQILKKNYAQFSNGCATFLP